MRLCELHAPGSHRSAGMSHAPICWWSELESNQPFGLFRPALIRLSYPTEVERAVRVELTNTGFAIQRLSHLATRAKIGTEGEIRTLESSLEDSHVSSYITSAWDASQGDPRFCGGVRTLSKNWTNDAKWSGRTESNCHHEFPGLGCERYTTPRN